MSAESTLNALRAANAARQRVFYAKHKVRVLADKREGYRLVRAQRDPPARAPEPDYQQYEDAADNEYIHDDIRHDYPEEMPHVPRARAGSYPTTRKPPPPLSRPPTPITHTKSPAKTRPFAATSAVSSAYSSTSRPAPTDNYD